MTKPILFGLKIQVSLGEKTPYGINEEFKFERAETGAESAHECAKNLIAHLETCVRKLHAQIALEYPQLVNAEDDDDS